MPSKNTVKEFAEDQYYHVYNRGVEKRDIFCDNQDYVVFIGLLKKYLTGKNEVTKSRHSFTDLSQEVELLSYCLMPNHFHLQLYQYTNDGVTKLMRRVITTYSMYFNRRYRRVGTLFQGRYKASHINADGYLHHISRYIHLNPEDYMNWPYSSIAYYAGKKQKPVWLNTYKVLSLFDNSNENYMEFLKEYQENKRELSVLKWQLANDINDV